MDDIGWRSDAKRTLRSGPARTARHNQAGRPLAGSHRKHEMQHDMGPEVAGSDTDGGNMSIGTWKHASRPRWSPRRTRSPRSPGPPRACPGQQHSRLRRTQLTQGRLGQLVQPRGPARAGSAAGRTGAPGHRDRPGCRAGRGLRKLLAWAGPRLGVGQLQWQLEVSMGESNFKIYGPSCPNGTSSSLKTPPSGNYDSELEEQPCPVPQVFH